MPASHFDLVSHWRIHAPVERVWAALVDTPAWPLWWPYVLEVQTLRVGQASGVGTRRRLVWATRLPYRIVIEVEGLESVRHQLLRVRSHGQLDGEGVSLLRAETGFTDVTYVWRVTLKRRWMCWLAPLLAPVFRWNHGCVMRAGEAGLRRYLEAKATPHAATKAG
ncbi:MAG: SRPBCC family protein [Proteobacteria bacterium]|nr:SRPBCC family protein [Pseudomonadota bacterium]